MWSTHAPVSMDYGTWRGNSLGTLRGDAEAMLSCLMFAFVPSFSGSHPRPPAQTPTQQIIMAAKQKMAAAASAAATPTLLSR